MYPSPTGSATAGAHQKHATSSGYNFTCDTCHFNGMPVTLIAESPPMFQMGFNYKGTGGGAYDGHVLLSPYSYDGTNGTTVTTNGTMTCSSIYCHSDGTSVTTGVIPANTSPSWGAAGPLLCNTCHGYPPQYAQDQPKSNSHVRHFDQLQQNSWFSCGTCHYSTTTDGVTISGTANHVNGQYDVNPSPDVTFTYTYDRGGGKCSNITCHGSAHPGFTNVWGGVVLQPSISQTLGPACFQVNFTAGPGAYPATPPYTFSWDFGDGATADGTTVSHIYADGNTYFARVTMTDASFHSGSTIASVVPVPSNAPPVANKSISVSGLTATLTDLSSDTDFNSCGHTGAGRIQITWGDGSAAFSQSLSLTASPSNAVFSHTYSCSTTCTYTIQHSVVDNSGVAASSANTQVTVPKTASGTLKITTSPPLLNVNISVKQNGLTKASGITDATGSRSFTLPPGVYQVTLLYPFGHGCTFTNGSSWTVTDGSTTTAAATSCF
jgi:predicted CxxxxCH...CXXCH cytochrome family protein